MTFNQEGRRFRAIAWRAAERAAFLEQHRAGVNLAFSLDRNEYQGETYLELSVADYQEPRRRRIEGRAGASAAPICSCAGRRPPASQSPSSSSSSPGRRGPRAAEVGVRPGRSRRRLHDRRQGRRADARRRRLEARRTSRARSCSRSSRRTRRSTRTAATCSRSATLTLPDRDGRTITITSDEAEATKPPRARPTSRPPSCAATSSCAPATTCVVTLQRSDVQRQGRHAQGARAGDVHPRPDDRHGHRGDLRPRPRRAVAARRCADHRRTGRRQGGGALEATAGTAGLARADHYIRLSKTAHVVADNRTIDADDLTATLTPGRSEGAADAAARQQPHRRHRRRRAERCRRRTST